MPDDKKKPVFLTSDSGIKEGKTHEVDEKIIQSAESGEGLIEISGGELMELAKRAKSTYDHFLESLRMDLALEQAAFIRELRCEKDYSWRMLAQACFDQKWPNIEPWNPPSNQIMGMALCEIAAEFFSENHMEPPWN